MSIFFIITIIVLLIILNAFFIAAETSLISSRKTHIDDQALKGNQSAKLVGSAYKRIQVYLSAPLIASTFISIALGSIIEPILAQRLEQYLKTTYAHTIAFLLALIFLTFLHVLFGELLPKTLVIRSPDKFVLLLIRPFSFFVNLLTPLVNLVNSINSFILKIFGIKKMVVYQPTHSREEIIKILENSRKRKRLSNEEIDMVFSILSLKGLPLKEIMVPKKKIIAVDNQALIEDINQFLLGQKNLYSRYPVYSKSIDNIIGHIHIANLHKLTCDGSAAKKLSEEQIVEKIIKIDEAQDAKTALIKLKQHHVYAGIVADKNGQTLGLVTVADIVRGVIR